MKDKMAEEKTQATSMSTRLVSQGTETNGINDDVSLTKRRQAWAVSKPYDPTTEEKAVKDELRARRIRTPRVKAMEAKAGIELSLDHPSPVHGRALLMQALGTAEVDFFAELMIELGKASSDSGKANERRLNFMIAVIKGIEPKDQLESMLAAQMAAVHSLTMEFASRLANAGDLAWRDSAERTLNKLARTFTSQVETLKRYRTGGEQKVTVQHVSVSDGGQAIVGSVTQAGAGALEKS